MMVDRVSRTDCRRSFRVNMCSRYLSNSSLSIYLRRGDLKNALDNQIMVVAGLTLLATLLSALFASFVLGVFQGSTSQPAIDVRVTRISKVAVVEDNVVWDLVISVRNNGGSVLEIPYIDIVINDDIVMPIGFLNIRSPIPLTIMPGELKVLRIIITNYNDPRSVSSDTIVFSDKRFNSGTMMSLRITDSRGYMVLVTFTLP